MTYDRSAVDRCIYANMLGKTEKFDTSGITIVVPGEPMPCARPRLSTQGGYVRVHDKQKRQKSAIKMMCRVEWNRQGAKNAFAGGVAVALTFYLGVPTSLSQKERNARLWGFYDASHDRGDLDNYEKLALDCLTGIAYEDDHQVIALKSRKVYSLKPRTEITIMEVPPISIPPRAEEILVMYGPEQFADLTDICAQILELGVGDSIVSAAELVQVAHLISRLADNHHKVLSKVAKTVPGFYLEG